MTELEHSLVRQIRAGGPISLADYMATCLMHPVHGYYATRDPLGQAGDFTTAPEISQMFGELVGLCLAQSWMDQGAPGAFTLAELGPGRGTLMADILRATARVPGFHDAMRLHLVEMSPVLRARQREVLAGFEPGWSDDVLGLPQDGPLFLVANEFFDALPVRQLKRDGTGWREHMIGVSDKRGLTSGWGGPVIMPDLEERLEDTEEGDIVEICPQSRIITAEIGARIRDQGGAALIIDYGDWHTLGDTVQAVRAHKPVPLLEQPGAADLSAHVDFETIARAAPCRYSRVTPQGVFLERLGIASRAQVLAQKLEGPALENHIAAFRRLTHTQEMGTLFKVMALYPEGAAPPPGLNE